VAPERHSLLSRQIRRFLTAEDVARPELQAFLDAVDAAYQQSDDDRLMLERSLELSSQELLQANSEMRGIFQALPDLFLRLDSQGTILDYKASNDIDLYVAAGQLVGKRIQDIPAKGVAEKFQRALDDLAGGARMAEVVYELDLPDRAAWYEARLLGLLEDQVIAVVRNVTELRMAEEERRLRLERVERQQSVIVELSTWDALATGDVNPAFETIARSAARGVDVDRVSLWILADDDTAYRCVSRYDGISNGTSATPDVLMVSQAMGYHDALLGRATIVTTRPHDDPRTTVLSTDHLRPARVESVLHAPVRVAGRLAGVVWLERVTALEWHDDEITFAGVIADQVAQVLLDRDRKKQEAELLRAQKLESLGVLAGGIAHDFNNTLTGILGNLSMVLSETEDRSELAVALREAEAATLRAKSLTRQLLTFATGGKPVKETVSLETLIRESVAFALRGSNVRASVTIPPDLPPVEVDLGQIGQVIHNLVLNADQAMPEGGTIEVTAEVVSQPAPNDPAASSVDTVEVRVTDRGVGIPSDQLEYVFDPYFTTKEGGSGLGLASSYSIISNHGGEIEVQSEVGVGSLFRFRLPVSPQAPRSATRDVPPDAVAGARVLVMDDEATILSVVRRMLERLGCEVTTAPNGDVALARYGEALDAGEPFDVVLLDLTVPGGMGGQDTLRLMRELDPDVRAIVCSGYSNDPVMAEFREKGFSGVIVKPFPMEDLAAVVGSVLEA